LRYYLDLPEDDIAAILNCRPSTVRSLVQRGLDRLREELSE
jgi:DNA-directed RNA polymerase specialized sigma24 family protein